MFLQLMGALKIASCGLSSVPASMIKAWSMCSCGKLLCVSCDLRLKTSSNTLAMSLMSHCQYGNTPPSLCICDVLLIHHPHLSISLSHAQCGKLHSTCTILDYKNINVHQKGKHPTGTIHTHTLTHTNKRTQQDTPCRLSIGHK